MSKTVAPTPDGKVAVREVTVQNPRTGTCKVIWTDERGVENIDHLHERTLLQQIDAFGDASSEHEQRIVSIAKIQLAAVQEALKAGPAKAEQPSTNSADDGK